MERLVVGIDGSEGGRAATEEALSLAREIGAEVTFVYVRPLPPRILGDPYYRGVLSTEFDKARGAVNEALELAEAAGVEADGEILDGDAADEIVSLADNRAADLIVVGSRGLGPVAGALLGSVSRSVLQHAHRPVLVAKKHAVAHSAKARRVA